MLLAIVRLFATAPVVSPVADLLAIFPLMSIVWGNLAAMKQHSLRRMIAYSSIAHAGYLLMGVVAGGKEGFTAVAMYLAVYVMMNVGAFAVVGVVRDVAKAQRALTEAGFKATPVPTTTTSGRARSRFSGR